MEKIKTDLDKAKKIADQVDDSVDKLHSFAGTFARLIPGLGEIEAVVVTLADGLRAAVDALDGVVSLAAGDPPASSTSPTQALEAAK